MQRLRFDTAEGADPRGVRAPVAFNSMVARGARRIALVPALVAYFVNVSGAVDAAEAPAPAPQKLQVLLRNPNISPVDPATLCLCEGANPLSRNAQYAE